MAANAKVGQLVDDHVVDDPVGEGGERARGYLIAKSGGEDETW